MKKLLLGVSFLAWTISCSFIERDIDPSAIFQKPTDFPDPVYPFEKNPLSADVVELGRQLFYEPKLSRDNTISCGECHNQSHAFTHHGHVFSHGIEAREGNRNAQPLINLAWQPHFFWDGGVFDLDLFSLAPIENPVEMDESIGRVLEKLRKDPTYIRQFKKAYGSEEVTTERFLKALSQFMLTLVSANSKYDQFKAGKAVLSADESAGLVLFQEKGCATCHPAPLFTDHSFRSNGLLPIFTGDLGRYRITENPADKNKFKVPTLRNVEVSGPYMHDGRYLTLDQAVEHYNSLIEDTGTLDPALKNKRIPLTGTEKRQLIAFLKTLTDPTYLTDPRFSEFYRPR